VSTSTIITICLLYVTGALAMARHQILSIQSEIDEQQDVYDKTRKREREEYYWRLEWDGGDIGRIFFTSLFWIFICIYYIIKFVMFPRGVKSKYAREKEKARKAKEAERKAAKAEEDLRKMQDEVLRFVPQESAAESLRRLKLVADGQRPDDDMRVAS
jgi:flagellar biosynthesis/type III secretory pathway M-ring protein FliF/YscJ